nr:MAG TPA: hypothetical protein [Bacteriophage sp.]
MKLNVKERLAILQMLPEYGSITEMVDMMEIVKKVRITSEEKDVINYKEAGSVITWDINKDLGIDIEFKHDEIGILKSAVKRLDEEKRVNMSNLDICLKINSL